MPLLVKNIVCISYVYLPIFRNEHWVFANIYGSMIDLTKDSVLVRQLLSVADMIHLVLQKIAYHETHLDCAEVISKIPWPIVRVHDIPQQKSGYVLYILCFEHKSKNDDF